MGAAEIAGRGLDRFPEFPPERGVHPVSEARKQATITAEKFARQKMKMIRRELLYLAGAAATLPYVPTIAWAQTQTAPKLTQILRKDLEGQGETVQETIVNVADFAPGTAAPWHRHPGAQELLHV